MALHPVVFIAALLFAALQHLTVTQLTLTADTRAPKLEVPFNLVVTGHVRERVTGFENVDLPVLPTLVEMLGDTRSVVANASGTTYRETIRVVAHHSGKITLPPVTLDAIDARDGKPKRYSSNALTIDVQGGALEPQAAAFPWFAFFVSFLPLIVLVVAVALLAWLLAWRIRRPKPTPPPIAHPVQTLPRPVQTRASRFRDALTTLRVERTRAVVMRIRHIAREMVGADDAETLADVVARPQADEPMRTLLRALERAAFTYDADLQAAIEAVIAQLERMS